MAMLQNNSELTLGLADIKTQVENKTHLIKISSNTLQLAVSALLEHSYLEFCNNTDHWNLNTKENKLLQKMTWFQLEKLPIQIERDNIGLLGRWQSVLTSAHKQGMQLAVALIRKNAITSIYIGAYRNGEKNIPADQLRQSISNFMEGSELRRMGDKKTWPYPTDILDFQFGGIATGIPSLKGEDSARYLQTLDSLAAGITLNNIPKNYAIIIRADAVSNREIEILISHLLDMKSALTPLSAWSTSITAESKSTVTQTDSKAYKASKAVTVAATLTRLVAFVAKLTPAAPYVTALEKAATVADKIYPTSQTLMFLSKGDGGSESINHGSNSTSLNYTDERNKYVISMIDEHIKRLDEGRSLGFWNTGVYVLGDDKDTVDTTLGMLKAVYSGKKTHLDPIRTYSERIQEGLICRYARNMELLPLPSDTESPFGPLYQYISTPITTAELSIECNLPRKDFTGLKNNNDAVRFSYNPPQLSQNARKMCLGTVYNEGLPISCNYEMDADAFVRHGVMVGESGSGKTTTIRTLIDELQKLRIPFLVIDPVKDGFIDWAIAYNNHHKNDPEFQQKRIRIYKPGTQTYRYLDMTKKKFQDIELDQFSINIYQPATYGKSNVNLAGHINTISTLLANSTGMVNSLPQLLKEAMRQDLQRCFTTSVDQHDFPANEFWNGAPHISSLGFALRDIMFLKKYEPRIKGNLEQCIRNILEEIQTGWKQNLISANKTTGIEELFEHPAVISLADLGSDEEKSFAITILMQWLRDYRISKYKNCMDYQIALRSREQLMHLAIIDEAHAILAMPKASTSPEEINPGQETAKIMKKILSELREYGQGVLVADQFASRLIEDVRKNTHVAIIHQMKAQDECELMGRSISLSEEQQNYIHSLKQGHMIIRYGSQEPCWVKVDNRSNQ